MQFCFFCSHISSRITQASPFVLVFLF
uniref:Uncharacterized protein n=1 Tax=Arundo donax TaxID=35708 RepID=A0A0A8Z483_ARUDO